MKIIYAILFLISVSCSSKKSPEVNSNLVTEGLVGKELNNIFYVSAEGTDLGDISLYLKTDGSYEMSKRIISLSAQKDIAGYPVVPAVEDQSTGRYYFSGGEIILEKPLWTSCDSSAGQRIIEVEKVADGYDVSGDLSGSYTAEEVSTPSYSILSVTKAKNREVAKVPTADNLLTFYGCLNSWGTFTETSSTEIVNTTK